jgi:hypothetical protein
MSRRSHRSIFDFAALRRREIERYARDVGATTTDDLPQWLIVWAQHNTQSKDPVRALMNAAIRMRGHITEADAIALLDEASETRRHCSADNVAKFLGVTYAQRERLRLTTIGSVDVGKRSRAVLRKRKARLREERRRRKRGAKPRAQALSNTKPWQALGMSRRNWYRRRRAAAGTNSCAATLPLMAQIRAQPSTLTLGTNTCAPLFPSLRTNLCQRKDRKGTSEGGLGRRIRRKNGKRL